MKKLCRFVILILVVVLVCISFKPVMKIIFPLKYKDIVIKYSEENDVDPFFIMSIIKAESNFDKDARSSKGALGLMQVTPSTGEWIAEKINNSIFEEDNLFDPDINIRYGTWYINYLSNKFNGNRNVIIAAYNAGPGSVDKWLNDSNYSQNGEDLDNIPFVETDKYVAKVNFYYNIYKFLYT
ncbi:lytic transglycosylase domain-containing protein [Clostridium bornimense]|uniref:lytic transglycosylase domain-containing protein n=2 Tax=Clostridium TaxID=1485 RepID=UPI001C0F6442|nr:lytic transglycosylase domain-containing protein [Clostridium bornimense]MBU5317242.1 lytic transglycosylase domain-containing protein [Clostridium bornimense]